MEHFSALPRSQSAQIIKCAAELLLAIAGHALECLGGCTDFLFALRGETLEGFVTGHDAPADRGWLRVKVAETTEYAFALRGSEPVEAGLAAQSSLLLLEAHVLVLSIPLGQVLTTGMPLGMQVMAAVLLVTRFVRRALPVEAAIPVLKMRSPVWMGCGFAMSINGPRVRRQRKDQQNRKRHPVDESDFGASFHGIFVSDETRLGNRSLGQLFSGGCRFVFVVQIITYCLNRKDCCWRCTDPSRSIAERLPDFDRATAGLAVWRIWG